MSPRRSAQWGPDPVAAANHLNGRVLIVAGSDSGGGAGIQADVKTTLAFGAYGMTAVTALTAQNTEGVFGIQAISPAFVRQQMELCISDIGIDAVKTGMLPNEAVIGAVADVLQRHARGVPLVVDPVMVAKGGTELLPQSAMAELKRSLLPLAAVLTPNLPEAEALTGLRLRGIEDMRAAAELLLTLGPSAILLKGGHLPGNTVTDVLVTLNQCDVFETPRLNSTSTHGTGCTLASAIAAGLARGVPMKEAVRRAREFVYQAIRTAPGLGKGHGPLNHAIGVKPFTG